MKAVTAASAAFVVLLAACGTDQASPTAADSTIEAPPAPDGTEATSPEAGSPATVATTTDDADVAADSASAGTSSSAPPPTQQPIDLAFWQTLPITDVDGVTFTLGEYVGRPLLIEPFATWCSKCRSQLGDTNQAASEVADDAAVVALSVETDLSPNDVAGYRADNDFQHIRFAVMSPELLAAMAEVFGPTVANPPSTPKIVVDARGRPGDLSTGPQSVDDLVAALRAADI